MLWKTNVLKGCRLGALDGELGRVKDFYFEDQTWTVRYIVADTGTWLPHRKVLISPFAVSGIRTSPHLLMDLKLTRRQVKDSPTIEAHKPVSRQMEARYLNYFGWPPYWPGPMLWGPVDIPGAFVPLSIPTPEPSAHKPELPTEDSHLRSAEELHGYHLQALDQSFGHVEQLVFEMESWAVRYLIIDTHTWWPGKRVLLSPLWVASVNWPEMSVYVDLDRASIQRAPEYNPDQPITREFEAQLFAHYSRRPYWESMPKLEERAA